MDADIQAIRDQFLGQAFDEKQFEIDPTVTAEYARLCGETLPKFTDPADPDFQASPTFVASLSGGRSLPSGFPRFGLGMDAGKGIEWYYVVELLFFWSAGGCSSGRRVGYSPDSSMNCS